MRFIFKCAENEEHVKKANVKVRDILDMFQFFKQFDVPTKWTHQLIVHKCGHGQDIALNHDIGHMIIDDLVIAWEKGHPVLNDEMFYPMMLELKEKQNACKLGHDHD